MEKEVASEAVYFAGEIVNPTSDYVVLYKNDAVVDSAKLDNNNRFAFNLKGIEEGLHHFDHSPQYQYVYLEKGDSVLIRLNASPAYFDESLVFSGSNELVNNFMIEMFLNHEDEEHMVYDYYKLQPEVFSQKIDSLRDQKLEELAFLSNIEEITENGYAVAKASVDFKSFVYKEKYPFYHKKKTGEDIFNELDNNFYGYRENLDLNDGRLSFFRPYYDFMKHYFGNLSYKACMAHCAQEEYASPKSQLHLNRHKMVMIDSLVNEDYLRDNLLRNVAMDYLLKVHMANNECDQFISDFEKLSTNQAHIEEIKHLFKGIKSLQPNKELPHLVMEDVDGNQASLKQIAIDKNAVFYFWTADQKRHFRNVIKRVAKLKTAHPDHHFIGINLRTSKPEWDNIIAEYQLNPEEQFRVDDFKMAQNTLIVDHLNKCIVSKDTLIVNGFGNLYASFEPTKKP